MIIVLGIVLLLVGATFLYTRTAKFGKAPSGERLERMEKSPHYKGGKFHNILSHLI